MIEILKGIGIMVACIGTVFTIVYGIVKFITGILNKKDDKTSRLEREKEELKKEIENNNIKNLVNSVDGLATTVQKLEEGNINREKETKQRDKDIDGKISEIHNKINNFVNDYHKDRTKIAEEYLTEDRHHELCKKRNSS